jgi:hypothetical protein
MAESAKIGADPSALLRRTAPFSSTPSVAAGGQIARSKESSGSGTACLVVTQASAPGKRFVLTCAHVLGRLGLQLTPQQAVERNSVYSPKYSDCCDSDCNQPFGSVEENTLLKFARDNVPEGKIAIGVESFITDAALVKLAAGAEAENAIPKIGAVASVRDLIAEWGFSTAPVTNLELASGRQITVRKHGATTGLTTGKLKRLVRDDVRDANATGDPEITQALQLEIEAAASVPAFQRTYKIDVARYVNEKGIEPGMVQDLVAELFEGTLATATFGGNADALELKISVKSFGQPGDSGSPIVDSANRVIGMLRGGELREIYEIGEAAPVGIHVGRAHAVFIQAAFARLGAALAPASPSAGEAVVVPGMRVARGPFHGIDRAALERARTLVEESDIGARFLAIGRRHFDEARWLVHHRRRVTVAWHRMKGPAFVAAIASASGEPDWPIPASIDGVTLADALRTMRNVLMIEGSASLKAAIAEHEKDAFEVARAMMSIGRVIEALDALEHRA